MDDDGAYEDYFERQMMNDTIGIEEYQSKVDYFEELKKVEERVAGMVNGNADFNHNNEDGLEDDYLMENIIQGSEAISNSQTQ